MNPDAQKAVQAFVASQKTAHGYMNAGGHEDAYYGQFGRVLEAVFTPVKVLRLPKQPLVVKESMGRDTIYGQFFAFLSGERQLSTFNSQLSTLNFQLPTSNSQLSTFNFQLSTFNFQLPILITNAVCCVLAMQHQMGGWLDAAYVEWLQQRQDDSGGFYASEQAPIPDLLSTAVALFTLRLIGAEVKDASQFVQAHWLDNGGFTPTLFDDYSDVEYVFYGLLALGTT